MKIKFDIDATPQELRTFFGLPDLEGLQKQMLAQIQEQLAKGNPAFDPVAFMKPFLPPQMQSLESLQKMFWSGLTPSTTPGPDKK
jgi:hypothetical protein